MALCSYHWKNIASRRYFEPGRLAIKAFRLFRSTSMAHAETASSRAVRLSLSDDKLAL
jgi:hypothetical protein